VWVLAVLKHGIRLGLWANEAGLVKFDAEVTLVLTSLI
jgi:hypothetical protein